MSQKIVSLVIAFCLCVTPCWGGIDFDGVDDKVSAGDISVESTPLSISAWIYVEDTTTDELTILAKFNSSGNGAKSFLFRVAKSTDASWPSALQFFTHNGTSQGNCFSASAAYSINTWVHIGVRFDGTAGADVADLFVNGVQVALHATEDDSVVVQNTTTVVTSGMWESSGSDPMDGIITEVALWIGVELTDAEFALLGKSRIKNMPLQIQPAYLKIYWPFDDGSAGGSADLDTAKDLSGNGNDGNPDDGANNTGLSWSGEVVLSYPSHIIGAQ